MFDFTTNFLNNNNNSPSEKLNLNSIISNNSFKTLLIITISLVFVGIVTFGVLYIFVHLNKINFNFWLGLTLSFLIGFFGFFGLFYSKEKDERKTFFLGWIISFTAKLIYFLVLLLIIII